MNAYLCRLIFNTILWYFKKIFVFQRGITDIGFAALYIINTRTEFIDYLVPYNYDYVCFMVKKPPLDPKWWNLFKAFQPMVWYGILIFLVASFSFIFIYANFYPEAEIKSINVVLLIYGIFFDQSMDFIHQIRKE